MQVSLLGTEQCGERWGVDLEEHTGDTQYIQHF